MELFVSQRSKRLSGMGCAAIALLASAPAYAQAGGTASAARAPQDGSDIIVTANRREEQAQKVGISITAVSGLTVEERNVRSAEDLGRLVPGLNATLSTGTGVSTIVIRGVGQTDFSDHQEQPNATYQDGVYVPFSTAIGIPLFDLQRIEALRGPQGTLFGRNATGGLLQYISNKPKPGLSGAVEGAIGERALRRVQGYINGGNDKIAARLAYYFQTQHGVIENAIGPDRGNKRVYALRGQILLKPTEDMTITLRGEGYNQYGTAPGYKAMPSYYVNGVSTYLPADVDAYGTGPGKDLYGYRNPYSGAKVAIDDPGVLNKRSRSYAGTIEQSLGDATLTSVTSYGRVYSLYREDTDSTPNAAYTAGLESSAHDFQEDLRLTGASGPFRYTLGAFFLHAKGNYAFFNDLKDLYDIPAGIGSREDEFYSLRTRSEAVYGQAEYDLTDKVTAILGARYTWDQFSFNFRNYCTQEAPGACVLWNSPESASTPVVNGIGPIRLDRKYSDWSGKVQVNYKPADNLLFYASASKGLKGAGFNQTASNNFPLSSLEFRPEKLYAYEVGEKAQFLDKRVTLNTSAYYYDYHSLQTFLFVLNQTQVINRNASAYGGEVELSVRPVRNLSANVGVAYNHFLIHGIATMNAPQGEGQRPINSPRMQINWGLSKTFDLADDYALKLNYFGRYASSVYYNIVNTPIVRAPSYSITDLSARLEAKGGWYVAAYLNNAFNKRPITGAFDVTALGYGLRLYGEPRTFSLSAGISF